MAKVASDSLGYDRRLETDSDIVHHQQINFQTTVLSSPSLSCHSLIRWQSVEYHHGFVNDMVVMMETSTSVVPTGGDEQDINVGLAYDLALM
jgi:hypothetical protein